MSLLTLIQDAMVTAGFDSPSIAYASTDATTKLFVRLSLVEGDALARRHDWRGLKVLAQMTGDGSSTEFALPADFDRFMTKYPIFIDGAAFPPLERVTDDEMLALKVASSQPYRPVWRLFGDNIEYYPAPEDGDVIKTEYRSNYWIYNEAGTSRQARWQADTDYSIIPERLVMLGTLWRYKQAKGFDYAEDFRNYQLEVAKEIQGEGGRESIFMRSNYTSDYMVRPIVDPRVIT